MNAVTKRIAALACALTFAFPVAALAAGSTASQGTSSEKEAPASAGATGASSEDPKEMSTKAGEPSEGLLEWASTFECAGCHETEGESAEKEGSLAHTHAALEFACIDCHTDDALVAVHEKVTPDSKLPKKLKKSGVNTAKCQSCHDGEDLAQATTESQILKDTEDTVVNPHSLPAVESHEDIDCGSCHKMHSSKGIDKTAYALCVSCHHAEVFACNTCHE